MEHLAFNATEQFENHAIIKFLESIGAEFGACSNAYTTCVRLPSLSAPTAQRPASLFSRLDMCQMYADGVTGGGEVI